MVASAAAHEQTSEHEDSPSWAGGPPRTPPKIVCYRLIIRVYCALDDLWRQKPPISGPEVRRTLLPVRDREGVERLLSHPPSGPASRERDDDDALKNNLDTGGQPRDLQGGNDHHEKNRPEERAIAVALPPAIKVPPSTTAPTDCKQIRRAISRNHLRASRKAAFRSGGEKCACHECRADDAAGGDAGEACGLDALGRARASFDHGPEKPSIRPMRMVRASTMRKITGSRRFWR